MRNSRRNIKRNINRDGKNNFITIVISKNVEYIEET